MPSALDSHSVVVLGGTGNVGSGVVHAFLSQGAHVIVTSRSQEKFEKLKQSLPAAFHAQLQVVVSEWDSDEAAAKGRDAIVKVTQSRPVLHIVSNLGFVELFGHALTKATTAEFDKTLRNGLYPNFLAAKHLLPLVANREGASYSFSSGGLANFTPPGGEMWSATVKNASLNALTRAFQAEFHQAPVRINALMISFGVAEHGATKNQFGMDSVDTYRLGPIYVAVALKGKDRGAILDLKTIEESEKLAASF